MDRHNLSNTHTHTQCQMKRVGVENWRGRGCERGTRWGSRERILLGVREKRWERLCERTVSKGG